MTTSNVYLTQEALDALRQELQFLRTKERARIAGAIAEAREKGDLSENAEYDAAKEAQGMLEAKIAQLESTVATARVIDERQIDTSKAFILSTVRVKNHGNGMEQSFKLVAVQEADVTKGKISVTSPIGKALLGTQVGDVVEVKVPTGKVKLEVLDISR